MLSRANHFYFGRMKNDLNIQMVDLRSQYEGIRGEVQSGFDEVFAKTAFINGPAVKSFEANLAAYLKVNHVIPCGNGTDALQLALMAMELKPGDEVIVPSFTFIATVEVIALLGLKPKFVEVDADTFNLDATKLAEAVTPETKAIVVVHLFGQCCDMDPVMAFAKANNLKVVEDNAQAIGASYISARQDRKAGTIGNIGTTSFYPSKNLGAYGDGGALMTNDADLAWKIRMMANHGMAKRYYHETVGVNSRLDTFQAVVLNAKLKKLDEYNRLRNLAADKYDKGLKEIEEINIPKRSEYSTHIFHQYTLKTDRRDALAEHLREVGIPNMIYYPVPCHRQKAYSSFYSGENMEITESLCKTVLSLPMHPNLTSTQLSYIIDNIHSFFKK